MPDQVLMPKQGNTVESCVILEWRKKEGDEIAEGDVLCEVESDKAAFEVESTATGTLLKIYFSEGDDVPVLTPIVAIGRKGEEAPELDMSAVTAAGPPAAGMMPANMPNAPADSAEASAAHLSVSPRARKLAEELSVDLAALAGKGSGPGSRIIERDVRKALDASAASGPNTAVLRAREAVAGTGASGIEPAGITREYPVKGVRRIVSDRMAASLRTTAQLTMHASADARSILAYRAKLKNSKKGLGLKDISINDLVTFAAVQTLRRYPALNAHYLGDKIVEFESIHAGFAVDTERGLMVPVIRFAEQMSLKELSAETARLGGLCIYGGISPDDFVGGTFTISNLGVLGVEMFTPILNPPQTAILGICSIYNRPITSDGVTVACPYIGFSLTVDHQAVDGAPAARYLKSLCEAVTNFELSLAG